MAPTVTQCPAWPRLLESSRHFRELGSVSDTPAMMEFSEWYSVSRSVVTPPRERAARDLLRVSISLSTGYKVHRRAPDAVTVERHVSSSGLISRQLRHLEQSDLNAALLRASAPSRHPHRADRRWPPCAPESIQRNGAASEFNATGEEGGSGDTSTAL